MGKTIIGTRVWPAGAAVMALLNAVLPIPASPAQASPVAGSAGTKLNVVVFLTDDQTVESFGKMQYVNSRPNTVRFDNAWVNNALCCPSRATLLSGQYDTHTGVENNTQGALLDTGETIATWLKRGGYRTALVGKYLNGVANPKAVPPGWDDFQATWPHPDSYLQYGYTMNSNGTVVQYGSAPSDYQVDVLTTKAKNFIAESARNGRPFLLLFAPTATHRPFVAGPGEEGMFDQEPVNQDPAYNEADVSDKPEFIRSLPPLVGSDADVNRRRQWAASVSVDHAFRALDQQLQASRVANTTAVIVLSDNGLAFGAHRWTTKMCQYRPCSQTPLLIRYPGAAKRTVGRYVSNVDVASTVADIAGVGPGIPQDGRSLLPLVIGQPVGDWPTAVLHHWGGGDHHGSTGHGAELPEFWAVRAELAKKRYTYVELATGERELYDLAADPYELSNVAGTPGYAAVQSALRQKLQAMRTAALLSQRQLAGQPKWAPASPLYVDELPD